MIRRDNRPIMTIDDERRYQARNSVLWAQFAAAALGAYDARDTASEVMAKYAALDADALLKEWRKRFDPEAAK